MVIRHYHWLNSASRVIISTCSAPLVQTGEQFFTVWPWPLTYNLDLQSQVSQGQGRTWCQKSRTQTVQTGERPQTNGHTHGCYQTYYLSCYAVDKKWCRKSYPIDVPSGVDEWTNVHGCVCWVPFLTWHCHVRCLFLVLYASVHWVYNSL